jgi:hypothetical protein
MKKVSGSSIRIGLAALLTLLLLSGCVVHPAHHRHVVVAKPVAKTVVVKPAVVVKKPVVVRKVVVH